MWCRAVEAFGMNGKHKEVYSATPLKRGHYGCWAGVSIQVVWCCSPLPPEEEGHEVAKGCWKVRIGKKLKVEQAAYRRSRPRWSVTSVLGIVHPMAPQGATRVGGEKSLSHTLPAPFRRLSLWWLTPPPSPRFAVGLWAPGSVPPDSARGPPKTAPSR